MNGVRVKISYDALAHNAIQLKEMLGSYYAVLKCDAYGHGAKKCAELLYELGHREFAVYSADEAIQIRERAPDAEILIFGRTDAKYAGALAHGKFIQTVFSAEYAQELSTASRNLRAHIKLDSGMNRAGFKCEAEQIKNSFSSFEGSIEGVYTHFPCADAADLSQTRNQLDEFIRRVSLLESLFGKRLKKHVAASAAALRMPEARFDACRIGLALYGISPENCGGICPLRPAMSLEAPISEVRYLKKGENIGYGCNTRITRDTVSATVSAGYSCGLPRLIAGRFKPVLHGQRVNLIGGICMDRCMVDITDLLERGITVKPYDTVQFFGGQVSVTELAECEGTIPYESLTRVGKMNKK